MTLGGAAQLVAAHCPNQCIDFQAVQKNKMIIIKTMVENIGTVMSNESDIKHSTQDSRGIWQI